ncbi:MAG: beta-lactamase family protein [Actinomycetota bacterium]|nr:beta-lactamase family protein [Actinomycetota bacterium]
MNTNGTCDDRFSAVRDAFAANFEPGRDPEEVGASVAVTVDGELVVDVWGGTITNDEGVEAPWQRDTIINVWSTTKTVSALSMLMLADRGELDFYSPVAKVWPEFAANGKADIEIRHVMSHMTGLAGWRDPITVEDLYDWDKATSLLAAQEPWWEPGTASGYHAVTQGYLEGEIVRRITGQTIGEFAAKEITGPLGADFHIGTPPECDARVGHVIPPATLLSDVVDRDSLAAQMFRHPIMGAGAANTIPWRRAEIPAAGGHGNARSVAMIHAPMACGGEANGVRLLSATGADPVFDEQTYAQDLVLPLKLRHGIGFGLPSAEMPISPSERACFWGGWGGSIIVIDLDQRMTYSYVMNRMGEGTTGDLRGAMPLLATYMALAAG